MNCLGNGVKNVIKHLSSSHSSHYLLNITCDIHGSWRIIQLWRCREVECVCACYETWQFQVCRIRLWLRIYTAHVRQWQNSEWAKICEHPNPLLVQHELKLRPYDLTRWVTGPTSCPLCRLVDIYFRKASEYILVWYIIIDPLNEYLTERSTLIAERAETKSTPPPSWKRHSRPQCWMAEKDINHNIDNTAKRTTKWLDESIS